MNYLEAKNQLASFPIFTTGDLKKVDPRFYPARLAEWIKKGYILKIAKGLYAFRDIAPDEPLLSAIANRLVKPSVLSLEIALARYGLIPESVYGVTSVTPRRTVTFRTPFGTFIYRKIKSLLMFGGRAEGENGKKHTIAEPEKALLDFLYLNPDLKTPEDFEGLRINPDAFAEKIDPEKLERYLKLFGNKALKKRVHTLLTFMRHAEPG